MTIRLRHIRTTNRLYPWNKNTECFEIVFVLKAIAQKNLDLSSLLPWRKKSEGD